VGRRKEKLVEERRSASQEEGAGERCYAHMCIHTYTHTHTYAFTPHCPASKIVCLCVCVCVCVWQGIRYALTATQCILSVCPCTMSKTGDKHFVRSLSADIPNTTLR
jgi:hypothetical protein